MSINGTDVEELLDQGDLPLGPLREIALDVGRGKVYFAYMDSIMRANLNGSGLENVLTLDFGDPTGLAIDVLAEKIYWTQPSKNSSIARIQRANTNGTGIETVVSFASGGLSGFALDIPIPEPGTFATVASLGVMLLVRRRRFCR